jgi:hypothetical protein
MTNIANHADSGKQATVKDNTELCVIVGWRRITGSWADIHEVVSDGVCLVRETTGFRVMHSEGFVQGVRS